MAAVRSSVGAGYNCLIVYVITTPAESAEGSQSGPTTDLQDNAEYTRTLRDIYM